MVHDGKTAYQRFQATSCSRLDGAEGQQENSWFSLLVVVLLVVAVCVCVCSVVWCGTFETPPCAPAQRPHVVTFAGVVPVHTGRFESTHGEHTHTHQTQHQRNITRERRDDERKGKGGRERRKKKAF